MSSFNQKTSYPLDMVAVDDVNKKVTGHQTISLSISMANGYTIFQANTYYYILFLSNDGLGRATRWYVDRHTFKSVSSSSMTSSWSSDTCWTKVYSHLANGTVTNGSLDNLRSAVNAGKRIRIVIQGLPILAFEPETLFIMPNYISAQKTRTPMHDPSDPTHADPPGRWVKCYIECLKEN